MKVLFVCHRFPFPPNRGGKIRPFNIIRHLNANHDVIVASMVRSPEEAAAGIPIADYCSRSVMAKVSNPIQLLRTILYLPSTQPSSMGYFYSPYLKERIQTILATVSIDLIFVHCSSVAPYVAAVKGIPKILDFGDMDSQKWLDVARYRPFPLSTGYWIEGQKLMAQEKRLAGLFDFCTATTQAELNTLTEFSPHKNVGYFPNGVDFDYFTPGDGTYDPHTLSFVGRMDYYPNQQAMMDFCRDTLPLVRARVPAVKLTIIGAESLPRDPATRKARRRDGHRNGSRCPADGAPIGTHRGALEHCPRHAEQDAGSHGNGSASDLQRGRASRRRRGGWGASAGRPDAAGNRRRRRKRAIESRTAREACDGQPKTGSGTARLAPLHAAAGRPA
jgi:sugar transferase (PEP-CTERM/EpsH1 system associated)